MSAVDEVALRRLLQVGRTVVSDLDADAVLERVLEAAREVTGARYAALGLLDEQRLELERFLTVGVDLGTRLLIGGAPKGRGVLGILIASRGRCACAMWACIRSVTAFPRGIRRCARFSVFPC